MRQKISLVVPIRDEESSVRPLLESIFAQETLPDEVIFVDGGSRDGTLQAVSAYIAEGHAVKVITAGPSYPGRGRNIGIGAAQNELIALADAGTVLEKPWLKELASKMTDGSPVDVVFGVYDPMANTFFKRWSSVAFVPPRRVVEGVRMRTYSVTSMLIKKRVWEEVGGFPDLRSAEDRIFIEKIREGSYTISFAPSARILWDVPAGPGELFSKFYLYSFHGIKANKMKDWHVPVMRIYVSMIPFIALGVMISTYLFAIPVLLFIARAFHLIFEKEEGSIFKKINPAAFMCVFFSMVLIDLALLCGIGRFIATRFYKEAHCAQRKI